MFRNMKPLPKLILICLTAGGLIYGVNKAIEKGFIPKGRTATETKEVKKAIKDGAKIVRVGVVTWGGYAGGEYFNGGFNASEKSRYFSEYNTLVQFVLNDDFASSRAAWKAGKVDLMWTTVDAFPTEVESLKEYDPVVVFQSDWSRGGDAIIVRNGINSVKDLKGKKISLALGTPSHSMLLNTLQAGNLQYGDITPIPTDSAVAAATMFKSGQVDAAVVWSPDDEDCIRNVAGSKILVNTKSAGHIIADVFFAKREFVEENKEAVKAVVEGWLRGSAEINTNAAAKTEAIQVLVDGLSIDKDLAAKAIGNARLTTIGDNVNFFNLDGTYAGVKGEDLYVKMHKMYTTIDLAPAVIPAWRNVAYTAIVRSIHLNGAEHAAEGGATFTAPTQAMATAAAYAAKPISVTYASGSSRLTQEGMTKIDMEFADVAKQFSHSRIRVEGNTDNVGTVEGVHDAQGVALSQRRAQSVVEYLASKYGFDRKRFIAIGHGPYNPMADNETEAGRALNRRTEFFLLDQ
jgi:NitT/TauT family transport system substrate-binding protein